MPARLSAAVARASMSLVFTSRTVAAPVCRYSPRWMKRSVTTPGNGARITDCAMSY